jgi:SWI/SNF-related matrix-associated actin-dependent regulator of chromatin subfamily A-like protein 1
MPTPMPTQLSGALFLAKRRVAMLADMPRVGKTGAAILAADYILAQKILVITTASGRPVWKRAFPEWSALPRTVQIMLPAKAKVAADVVIVSWGSVSDAKVRAALLAVEWDLLISDEDHYAKNFDAKRTQALYGTLVEDGASLVVRTALAAKAKVVWPLTGTPLPHSPFDTYPRLRSLAPERLMADASKGWPDVTKQRAFMDRYTVYRMKEISRFNRIPVIMKGKNEAELAARLDGFFLRRTQKDVGIRPPRYEVMPLLVGDKEIRAADGNLDHKAILEAAQRGDTRSLDMHLGPLRRITGAIKAKAVVEAVKEEMENGLDKIVLMYWHKEVRDILAAGLSAFGLVEIDGSTRSTERATAEQRFADPSNRIFLGQIVAAGEAIDLSAAAELWFVETSFSPKDMSQASLRITNHSQKRNTTVRVCALSGSIDEPMQERLLNLWTAINGVIGK